MEVHTAAAVRQAIQGHPGIYFLYLLALKKKTGWAYSGVCSLLGCGEELEIHKLPCVSGQLESFQS